MILLKKETIDMDNRFGDEYAGKYVFQEITWAKRSRIIQKHTKYHRRTGQVISSDYVSIQAETIRASLKEQPKQQPISLDKLLNEEEGIPIELGELFSKVANKLNSLTSADIRFLLERLSEEDRTRLFQSFGFAKSSAGGRKT